MQIHVRHSTAAMRLVLFVSAAMVLSTGCTPDVKEMRTAGVQQFQGKRYLESMATMRQVLELAPNDAEANYYMGLNYQTVATRKFTQGDVVSARRELDIAIVYYTQAIKTWPNYMAAVSAKTGALELRGKFEQALTTAETVADNNRGVAEHYVFLGNQYRDRGDYDNALRAYQLALSTDPKNAPAYAAMSKLYARIGDLAHADEAMQKAGELSGEQPAPAPSREVRQPPATGGSGNSADEEEAVASPPAPAADHPRPTGARK